MSKQTLRLAGNEGVDRAVELLKAGECVALPTETVYGLAADASSEEAVAAVFTAKGRPSNHPLIVHLASVDRLSDWAHSIPDTVAVLAKAFWPGPLTLLLRKSSNVTSGVTGEHETIAVRVPEHPLFRAVLEKSQLGLAAPSANRYKKLSPTSAEQVLTTLDGRIAAVLDGGPSEFGLESTIVDVTGASPRILRSGPITRKQLEAVLGEEVLLPVTHEVAVPGNVEAHYQPNTPLTMVDSKDLIDLDSSSGALVYSEHGKKLFENNGRVQQLSKDPTSFGQKLYGALHELDQLGLSQILVERPPSDEAWAAINDRLKRAVGV